MLSMDYSLLVTLSITIHIGPRISLCVLADFAYCVDVEEPYSCVVGACCVLIVGSFLLVNGVIIWLNLF